MELLRPTLHHLPSYTATLERGWSAGPLAAAEELARIVADPGLFIERIDDHEALGAPVALPDGSPVARLPGLKCWIWDEDGFAGSIGLRWQPGTTALPAHVLGHIGYAVVPWKQRRGYAKRALALMLPLARAEGLAHVELSTDPDNIASQRVIEANGGVLIERFTKPAAYGSTPGLRYRIVLTWPVAAV